MKFTGQIVIPAARADVFDKLRDARVFASCIEGVHDLVEVDGTHFAAVLETKVAYMTFKFKIAVELVRVESPREIEARIEGNPLGIIGRLTANSIARLSDHAGGTLVGYDVDAALTGKLGSLGQPVLRAKAKDMERTFVQRLRDTLGTGASENPSTAPI